MGLSKKTFCYSIIISLVIVIGIILYFSFMLPSLYVDAVEKSNLQSIAEVQRGYMDKRSYEGLTVKNPTGSTSVEIPFDGNHIYAAGKSLKITIEIKDEEVLDILNQIRDAFSDNKDLEDMELPDIDGEKLWDKIFPKDVMESASPFSVKIDADGENFNMENGEGKVHIISDSIVVFEGGISDGDNQYTTYIAAGRTEDAMILSFLPVMTPQMKEIRPIVFGSLPMITAVVFLIVLAASQIFSKRIVNPLIRLSDYAYEVRMAGSMEMEPFKISTKDEIGELGQILNDLYAKLGSQYRELEEKNQMLVGENKRQEVFLRASSHQLKTPVTAALLLIEGMIGEVGKYRNTKEYLPEVKKQLRSMQRIIEDILYLNHCTEHIEKGAVDMELLMKEVVEGYKVQLEEKRLKIVYSGHIPLVMTDREIMKKIVDNLFSNAVSYTPEGERIEILYCEDCMKIYNHGAYIEEELLPHIYEPFVSSDVRQKGRGLGLYVASYYAEILGCMVTLSNDEDGVQAVVSI